MIALILLAGGSGARFGSPLPKQFLPLNDKPVAHHSLEIFTTIKEITEIIVVCAEDFRPYFSGFKVRFADPGARRQNSVFHGLQKVSPHIESVIIHDAARPFIDQSMILNLIAAAEKTGAATVGMPVKFTVKECTTSLLVSHTPDRDRIWEIQTPQMVKKEILEKGFSKAFQENLTVTDDVSLAEIIGTPVQLVHGSNRNLKITTSEDLLFAEALFAKI